MNEEENLNYSNLNAPYKEEKNTSLRKDTFSEDVRSITKNLINNVDALNEFAMKTIIDILRGKGKFAVFKDKHGEGYDAFLERQGERYLKEQQALHYTPPKVDKPDVDDYKNAKEFIANLAIPNAPRGGKMSNKAYFGSKQFQSAAQTAGIIFDPEMIIEGTGDNAKEVPTGEFVAAHMSNSASLKTPVRINPNEPIEAIQGKLAAIYLY